MKDKIKSVALNVWNHILYFLRFEPTVSMRGFEVSYSDDFTTMTDKQLEDRYLKSQPWGSYHPDGLYQWYDPSAVVLNSSGLNLHVTGSVYIDPGKNIKIEKGVGLVHSKRSFGYGMYEWNIFLPEGKMLWPAIWTSCGKTWPPEIDVLEGYSDKNGRYNNELETNIHLGNTGENHYSLGAMTHGWLVDRSEKLNLKCHWEKDFIKIYYNNYLVRVVSDKRSMAWFNAIPEQAVIMNAALRGQESHAFSVKDHAVKPLIVENFTHWKKK